MYHEQEEADDSKLRGLGVAGGFTTPPYYFSHLHTHILNRTSRASDQHSGLPPGYFEQSRSAILQKTVGSSPVVLPLTAWYRRPVYQYLAAASVMLCLSVIFWFPQQSAIQATAASITDEEIMNYLERSDLRDVNITDVNFTASAPAGTEVEQYIISHSDDQSLFENL